MPLLETGKHVSAPQPEIRVEVTGTQNSDTGSGGFKKAFFSAGGLLDNAQQRPLLTLELSPPKGSQAGILLKRATSLKGLVDAINVPDCQRALLRMSAQVAAYLIQRETGIEAVWQLTCRDRNVLALQADLLGAQALGLGTVLALSGDPVEVGNQKQVAKNVKHLEAVGLLELIGSLNKGQDATGRPFPKHGTELLAGAALNPLALSKPAQRQRLCAKLEAGARFLQTQPIYNADQAALVWEAVLLASEQVGCPVPYVLLGLVPPKDAEAARYLNRAVPGIAIPDSWISQLQAEGQQPEMVSLSLCAELAASIPAQARQGWHLMPVRMEKHAARFARLLRQAIALPVLS